jgi:hypothetical protein
MFFSFFLSGASFGLIFGMLDVEDFVGVNLRDALVSEERKCIPVGIALGAAAALLNEYMAGDRNASPEKRGYMQARSNDFYDNEDGL